ncbi:MAG: hypothetical protein ISR64_07465 [Deltaproteobacteria bacterium]|nr:hypothetical protein [Deltaproteobacteria bacterium]
MNQKSHGYGISNIRRLPVILGTAWLMTLAACGSGAGVESLDGFVAPEPPTASMSNVQEQWTEAEFDQWVAGSAELAGLRDQLAGQGFDQYVTSGRLEDEDGVRLDFGTYRNKEGEQRAVVQHCASGDCVGAVAGLSGESMTWTDGAGGPLTLRTVAIPYLVRQTLKQDPEEGTFLATPLVQGAVVDPSGIDLGRRRLVVAHQFGDAFGVQGSSLAGDLASSNLFTEVVSDDYLTWPALETYLSSSYPHEVLVVASQSLRQLYRDSEDASDRWHRTLGIEVQNGLYGFDWVSAQSLRNALKKAPLSGPGVVLLMGAESLGDETDGMINNHESMYTHMTFPGKVVAGFLHQARPELLQAASREFLDRLGNGQTSGEARERANFLLKSWGSEARLAFTPESDEEFRLAPARENFWGDRVPKTGVINPFIILRPWCVQGSGKETALDEREGNPWVSDLVLDGPVFRGSRDHEVDLSVTLHMEMLGVLGEIRKGAHFFFVFQGGLKKEFPELTLYGNARITDVIEKPDSTTIRFDGTGEVLPFENSDGESCTFKYMLLEPLIGGTGKYSELTLEY